MTKHLVCILCPQGCRLEVELDGQKVVQVRGNGCARGKNYGAEECTNPVRIVTSNVKVVGGEFPLVSVKTAKPIPKALIWECMKAINAAVVKAPVSIGQVIIPNVAGSGVDVVATRQVAALNDMVSAS